MPPDPAKKRKPPDPERALKLNYRGELETWTRYNPHRTDKMPEFVEEEKIDTGEKDDKDYAIYKYKYSCKFTIDGKLHTTTAEGDMKEAKRACAKAMLEKVKRMGHVEMPANFKRKRTDSNNWLDQELGPKTALQALNQFHARNTGICPYPPKYTEDCETEGEEGVPGNRVWTVTVTLEVDG